MTTTKPNFRIVEEDPIEYWSQYYEFIKLYNKHQLTVEQIRQTLGLSRAQYRRYRDKAIDEKQISKNRKPVNIRYKNPKHYHKNGNGYTVSKNIKGKLIVYGTYPNTKIAEAIVTKLIQCNWDKTQLKRIQKEVAQ